MVLDSLRFVLLDESIGSITAGSQWLVWNYESDSTLAAAIEGRLGAFPECVSDLFLRNSESLPQEERNFRVCLHSS